MKLEEEGTGSTSFQCRCNLLQLELAESRSLNNTILMFRNSDVLVLMFEIDLRITSTASLDSHPARTISNLNPPPPRPRSSYPVSQSFPNHLRSLVSAVHGHLRNNGHVE